MTKIDLPSRRSRVMLKHMDRACPKCTAPMPASAKFCSRCGADVAVASAAELRNPLSPRRRAIRELVVGWILFIVGGALSLAGLLWISGMRGWVVFGVGVSVFSI